MSEKESNLRIAASIYGQFAWNGHTFRDGDCVALLDGRIVAVAGNPDHASARHAADEEGLPPGVEGDALRKEPRPRKDVAVLEHQPGWSCVISEQLSYERRGIDRGGKQHVVCTQR